MPPMAPSYSRKIAGKSSLTLNSAQCRVPGNGRNTLVLANTTDVAELVKATDTHAADMAFLCCSAPISA